jgi:hypothetical protein
MTGLQPRLELAGCHFSHVEAWLDPRQVEDLWYFDGPPTTQERVQRNFHAVPHRLLLLGHLHCWLLATAQGVLPWPSETPIRLDPGQRHLIVIHAVCQGHCALLDTDTSELFPITVHA